jgi:hypothetical protein
MFAGRYLLQPPNENALDSSGGGITQQDHLRGQAKAIHRVGWTAGAYHRSKYSRSPSCNPECEPKLGGRRGRYCPNSWGHPAAGSLGQVVAPPSPPGATMRPPSGSKWPELSTRLLGRLTGPSLIARWRPDDRCDDAGPLCSIGPRNAPATIGADSLFGQRLHGSGLDKRFSTMSVIPAYLPEPTWEKIAAKWDASKAKNCVQGKYAKGHSS